MQRFGISDMGPVPHLATDQPDLRLPRVPKMRRSPPPNEQPHFSYTIETPRKSSTKSLPPKAVAGKSTKKVVDKKKKVTTKTAPKKKVEPQMTAFAARKKLSPRFTPKRFTGSETMKIKREIVPPLSLKGGKVKVGSSNVVRKVKSDSIKPVKPKKQPIRWKI